MASVFDHEKKYTQAWRPLSDRAFLARLRRFQPLAEEDDPRWQKESYWTNGLYKFWAFAQESARRRLAAAIPLLLDRATEFDQDNLLEGLRHAFEEIMRPDWQALADICIAKAGSPRVGTRKWSLYQLAILNDERAIPVLKKALRDKNPEVRDLAQLGIDRLAAATAAPQRANRSKRQ